MQFSGKTKLSTTSHRNRYEGEISFYHLQTLPFAWAVMPVGMIGCLGYPIRHVYHVYVMTKGDGNSAVDAELLFSVSQLANHLGVSARTVRFYEDKGLISPRRAGNNRVYTARDRARMTLILRGKKLGFTLKDIKQYLDLYDADPTHAKQLRLLLKAVSSRIAQLEDQRVALEQALADLHEVESQAHRALAALDKKQIGVET